MKQPSRRDFIRCAAGGAGALACASVNPAVQAARTTFQSRPNVVLIMTDDQGYGDLGCHGNPVIKTPHIDHLYRESVRFSRFFVSPTCSPTRAALLTGRHEFRCGITHTILGRSLLREEEVTIADMLAGAGYATGIFGKWHLGDNFPCRPMDRGFQECLFHGGGGITQTPDYWGNTYFDPILNHNGVWEKNNGYCTDIFFSATLSWIGKNRDRPFFAYITPNAPHEPLQVSPRWSDPYAAQGIGDDAARFYGMITNIDDNVGRFLSGLRLMGLEEKTLVIFMTDNGSAQACSLGLYNAGMRACKGTAHEGGVRVPCFFRWPGMIGGGYDIVRIGAHIDLLPTLVELCGAELPHGRQLDGISLVPLLAGDTGDWPDRFLMTHVGRWPAGGQPQKYEQCSVRSQRFRLVDYRELYDIESDPGEQVNVIDRYHDEANSMRIAYDAWWDEVFPGLETPQHIRLCSDAENPALLTCMDWRSSLVTPGEPDWLRVPLWIQDCLEALALDKPYLVGGRRIPGGTMGSWAVEFTRPGTYAFTLLKLPHSASEDARRLKAGSAHLWCGSERRNQELHGGETAATFEIRAGQGPAFLECWFTGQRYDGGPSGAYYVEVTYRG